MEKWKITGVPVKSLNPAILGSPACVREVIEIHGDYAVVRVGDRVYRSTEPSDERWQIGNTLNAVLNAVLGEYYSGYVHNYAYADGYAYETEDPGPFTG